MTYFINNKTHEIHQSGCDHVPKINKFYLGIHKTLESVVVAAISEGYVRAKCCSYCCSSTNWE